jgi:hypothetical protein
MFQSVKVKEGLKKGLASTNQIPQGSLMPVWRNVPIREALIAISPLFYHQPPAG